MRGAFGPFHTSPTSRDRQGGGTGVAADARPNQLADPSFNPSLPVVAEVQHSDPAVEEKEDALVRRSSAQVAGAAGATGSGQPALTGGRTMNIGKAGGKARRSFASSGRAVQSGSKSVDKSFPHCRQGAQKN